MDELIRTVFLGLLQGVAELFPISSLGHTVLVPALLGWTPSSTRMLPPDRRHAAPRHGGGTGVFYWRDWYALIRAFLQDCDQRAARR